MPNPFAITSFNVSVINAPQPSKLQRSGAVVSLGGTTLAAGATQYISDLADATAIAVQPAALTSLSWTSGLATATMTTTPGIATGQTLYVTISGAVPNAYNGRHLATITGPTHFTYALASDPGSETTPGSYQITDALNLIAAATTYFAQGPAQGFWVLETGAYEVDTEGLAALETYINANQNAFYAYRLLSILWNSSTATATYVATFTAPTAMQYFWFDESSGATSHTLFAGSKSAMFWAEAPGTPPPEDSACADFAVTLSYSPSSASPLPPNAYAFLFGVTPWPSTGQGTALAAFKAAFVNVVAPASVGGLSNSMVYLGTYMDGSPFNYWYAVDWVQITGALDLNAAVINGSNNKFAPLYYNQQGINQLQRTLLGTMTRAITNGMALGQLVTAQLPTPEFAANFQAGDYDGQVVVNADPFTSYTAENPSDYEDGAYNGLTVVFTPLRGFQSIIVGLVVSNIPSGG